MKPYPLMNKAFNRNSTILLKTYENWYPHDDHSCGTLPFISIKVLNILRLRCLKK